MSVGKQGPIQLALGVSFNREVFEQKGSFLRGTHLKNKLQIKLLLYRLYLAKAKRIN